MISMEMRTSQDVIHVPGKSSLTLENMMKETLLGMQKQVLQQDKMLHGMKQILIQQTIIGLDLIIKAARMKQIQDITIIKMKQ